MAVFYELFVLMLEAFELYGGTIGVEYGLIESLDDKNFPDHPREEPEYSNSVPKTIFWVFVTYHDKRAKNQDRLKKTLRGGGVFLMIFPKKLDRMWFDGMRAYLHDQYSKGLS